jgi:hypothetical protein
MTYACGKNGLIYVSGTELSQANSWAISIDTPTTGYSVFGSSWEEVCVGVNSWSGNVAGYHDQDAKVLADAATAGVAVALLIYPSRTDLTTYYNGSAAFGYGSEGSTGGGPVGESSDFTGSGTLTRTGFS